jgi:hypothetical protein
LPDCTRRWPDQNAGVEVRGGGAPELQQQWREIAATLEKMRALMGV